MAIEAIMILLISVNGSKLVVTVNNDKQIEIQTNVLLIFKKVGLEARVINDLIIGKSYNELLGKIHFWTLFEVVLPPP